MRQTRSLSSPQAEVWRLRQEIIDLERRLSEMNQSVLADPARPAPAPAFDDQASIRRLLAARRARDEQLGADLFADPAWEILLEALAAEFAQKRISVSGLCDASAVPATTALRWINKLEQNGLLVRHADPLDGRRDWIQLTPEGSVKLRAYLHDAGLNLVAG